MTELTRYDRLRRLAARISRRRAPACWTRRSNTPARRLEGQLRYDGTPLLDHDAAVAAIVVARDRAGE